VPPAVHLDDLRCDGSAHGDCQASCLLFWHTAWLTPVTEDVRSRPEPGTEQRDRAGSVEPEGRFL